MRYYPLICLICALSFSLVRARQANTLIPGQKLPEVSIPNVSNYPSEVLDTRDLQGKFVIFDFYEVGCPPCIEAFPKLNALQQDFKDRLQLVLISKKSKEYNERSLAARKKYNPKLQGFPDLISINEDTLLNAMFPHVVIPHYVWIDGNGTVRAITTAEFVTAENIEKMLSDKNYKLPVKKEMTTYNYHEPLLSQTYFYYPEKLKYYSSLFEVNRELAGGQLRYAIDSTAKTIRITRTATILGFYSDIFTGFRSIGSPYDSPEFDYGKRFILETDDPSRFLPPANKTELNRWRDANTFSYETVQPLMPIDSAYLIYLSDINRFFNTTARLVKRKMKCLSIELAKKNKLAPYNTKRDGPRVMYTDSAGVFHLTGFNISVLRNKLSQALKETEFCIVDNTNVNMSVTMQLRSDLQDLNAVKAELLQKYGIELRESVQDVDVLVVSDKISWGL